MEGTPYYGPTASEIEQSQADERALIEDWLANKHSVSWGESFDITRPDRREAAARWFQSQMDDYFSNV